MAKGKVRDKGKEAWWRRVDLNHRPRAYESPALPLSYTAISTVTVSTSNQSKIAH